MNHLDSDGNSDSDGRGIILSACSITITGANNTVVLTSTDSSGGGNKTRSFNFVTPTYLTLTPDYAVGAPETSGPGFKVRVSQIDAGGTTLEPKR